MNEINIQRIDTYEDERFDQEALNQHGCFVVNGKFLYQIKIISKDSALISGDEKYYNEVINDFRFFAEHIINFYSMDGKLIKKFDPPKIFTLKLDIIQPTQFYIDRKKLDEVKTFVKNKEDIIIPVAKYEDQYISLDGHTRLYLAYKLGFSYVYAFITKSFDGTDYFVKESKKRRVKAIKDMILLSHEDYRQKWDKFCDEYFSSLEN
ncbi:hypothetical protein [Anaerococcus sp. Marseille-P3625]|uniref:hypothetical protein n=1 Tax=Anaerococcus sp. Marseille-P3625 TaxID=1977277 RepID=UPI00215170FD|nr:hypothetical protein [Anaerococcus sp. Marseille-P3625]